MNKTLKRLPFALAVSLLTVGVVTSSVQISLAQTVDESTAVSTPTQAGSVDQGSTSTTSTSTSTQPDDVSDFTQLFNQAQDLISGINKTIETVNRLPDIFSSLGQLKLPSLEKIFKDTLGALGMPDMKKVDQEADKKAKDETISYQDAVPVSVRIRNQSRIANSEVVRDRVLGKEAQEQGKKTRESAITMSKDSQNRNQSVTSAAQSVATSATDIGTYFSEADSYAARTIGFVNDSTKAKDSAVAASSTQDVLKEMAKILDSQTRQDQEALAINLKSVQGQVASGQQMAAVSSQLESIHKTAANSASIQASQLVQTDEMLRLQGATYETMEQLRRMQHAEKEAAIKQQAAEVSTFSQFMSTSYRSPGTYKK